MFFPLSFKKLKRRLRSPFTLIKKKISKNRKNKQLHALKPDVSVVEQPTPAENPVDPLASSIDASSASDVRFPPTPVTASGPVACGRVIEHEQDEVTTEDGRILDRYVTFDTQALVSLEPVVEDLAANVKVKETKMDVVHVEDVAQVVDKDQGIKDDVSAEVLTTTSTDPIPVKELVPEHVAKDKEVDQDAGIVSKPLVIDVEVKFGQIVDPPVIDNFVQEPRTVCGDDEDVVKEVVDAHLMDSAVQEGRSTEHGNGNSSKQRFDKTSLSQIALPAATTENFPTPPATPTRKVTSDVQNLKDADNLSLTTSVNILTPPTTPRKRATSDMREDSNSPNKDAEILAELQASVRSREKKRIAREQAEKERKERERELVAKRTREISEQGSLICDPEEKDHVLREVRSWRKQREASLKVNPDDEAKNASYRAAFANEEIMSELQNAARSRAQRAPCLDSLQEKRQLALEELYASRFQAVRA